MSPAKPTPTPTLPTPRHPQSPPPPQFPTACPPLSRNSETHYLITSLPHYRAPLHPLKTAILCFQCLTHSSQFTISPIPFIFLALRTLCQKHPGVGYPLSCAIPLA